MDIEIKEGDDIVNITVNGDIEMMTIKSFKQKLFEIGQNKDKDIEIDLSNVEKASSILPRNIKVIGYHNKISGFCGAISFAFFND